MEKVPKKFQIFPAPNYKARKKKNKISPHKKNIFGVGRGGVWGGGGGVGTEYAM